MSAPLIAAVSSWGIAQVIKTFIFLVKNKNFNIERLVGAGGMPSAHSATVGALTTSIFIINGGSSSVFAVSFLLSLIVMYDAMGVRRASGLHAKEINKIRKILKINDGISQLSLEEEKENDNNSKPCKPPNTSLNKNIQETLTEEFVKLKEFLGHTPLEVLCGVIIGIMLGMIITFLVM